MTIALTAVVRPSVRLRLLQAGFAVSALAVSAQLPFILELSCAAASFLSLFSLLRGAKTHRLDISGIGQVRLVVYLKSARESLAEPVDILAGSTCWPWLLLLRLRRPGGAVAVLIVLPDSVAPGVFRPLALACRACTAKKL